LMLAYVSVGRRMNSGKAATLHVGIFFPERESNSIGTIQFWRGYFSVACASAKSVFCNSVTVLPVLVHSRQSRNGGYWMEYGHDKISPHDFFRDLTTQNFSGEKQSSYLKWMRMSVAQNTAGYAQISRRIQRHVRRQHVRQRDTGIFRARNMRSSTKILPAFHAWDECTKGLFFTIGRRDEIQVIVKLISGIANSATFMFKYILSWNIGKTADE
jgi:hypothetical protein